jgi:hypothetical protein
MLPSTGKTFGDHSSLFSHVNYNLRKKKPQFGRPIAMEEPPFTTKTNFEVYGEEMIDKEFK